MHKSLKFTLCRAAHAAKRHQVWQSRDYSSSTPGVRSHSKNSSSSMQERKSPLSETGGRNVGRTTASALHASPPPEPRAALAEPGASSAVPAKANFHVVGVAGTHWKRSLCASMKSRSLKGSTYRRNCCQPLHRLGYTQPLFSFWIRLDKMKQM